ncbi:hypothetical protein RhiLY_11034 [Ceratobasidium sp. AG-Ba]|nr:hypothetical protein RhiLY_11034 [Ceratobasidium sp. AG-Ba]
MKALSLTFLELRCAYLSEEGVSTAYSMMPMAWSTITNLSLDEFHVTEKELHWFTELPVLEELTVELSVSQPPTPDSTESISQRNTSFKTLRSSHDVDIKGDIHQIARWLLSLWPTIEKVDWERNSEDTDASNCDIIANGLNSAISIFRQLRDTKSKLATYSYGAQALKLFHPEL